MKYEPQIKITNNMIITYHGGSCNPAKNKTNKRSQIKEFTKASQRRLCIYTDTVLNFIPTRIIVLTIDIQSNQEEYIYQLQRFCIKLTNYLKKSSYKEPLFIWRKIQYLPDKYEYIILTNIQDFFSNVEMDLVFNFIWKLGKAISVPIKKEHYKKTKTKFCMMKIVENKGSSPPGKYWGVINKKKYKNKEPKIIKTTLLELIKLEAKSISPPENEKFQKNIFLKK